MRKSFFYACVFFFLLQSCSQSICRSDRDCEKGSFCSQDNRCLQGCKQNSDCQANHLCSEQGNCVLKAPESVVDSGSVKESEIQEKKAKDCDERQERSCFSGDKKVNSVGVCKAGKQVCRDGAWGPCIGQVLPSTETCDKKDNDCDGQVDEELNDCRCSINSDCPPETPHCQAGQCIRFCKSNNECRDNFSCKFGYCQPCADGGTRFKKEECNGKDDNCDGSVDEGLSKVCGRNIGECKQGTQTCSGGVWSGCVGEVVPTKEVCNGKDDDCDGTVDEGLNQVCGSSDVGACKKGKRTCEKGSWGPCVGSVEPRRETCDKTDDDCDGKVDEDIVGCGCKQDGDCPATKPKCQAGICIKFCTDSKECLSDEYCHQGFCQACGGGTGSNKQEVCNDRDDDCDGTVDEGLTRDCGDDTGACQKGTQTCVGGSWGACAGEITATTEVCNGKDDDCDGSVDEGLSACRFEPKKLALESTIHTKGMASHIRFRPDGKMIAYNSGEVLYLYHLVTKKEVALRGHSLSVASFAFSPDGKTIASVGGSGDGYIKLWRTSDGKLLQNRVAHGTGVAGVLFSPDGKMIVTYGYDKYVKFWDSSTLSHPKTLSRRISYLKSMSMSPDSKLLLTGDYVFIQIWDVVTRKHRRIFRGHEGYVTFLAFAPDGKSIVSLGDARMKFWDPSTFALLRELKISGKQVLRLTFHSSGNWFATVDTRKNIKFWETSSGKEAHSIHVASIISRSFQFHPDSKRIAFSTADKTIQIWKQ